MGLPQFPSTNFKEEFDKARRWLMESRRSQDTKLVTAGYILEPPFSLQLHTFKDELMHITISGTNGQVTIPCNKIITSKFRQGQIGFFVFTSEGSIIEWKVIAKLTRSYQLILEAFPPNSVFSSEDLYNKIKTRLGESQRHARRRWKELKYDYGFDVDFDVEANKYRRGPSSVPVYDPNIRPDDKILRKTFLKIFVNRSLEEHKDTLPHCNRCDARVVFKEIELPDGELVSAGLLDHRRPVFQGGDDTESNLHIFCQTCNNLKNTICRNCPYKHRCDSCIWAFPEIVRSRRMVLILKQEIIDKIRAKYGDNPELMVTKDIEKLYQDD